MVPFWSMGEAISQVGSAVAGLMVAYAMFQNYFPYEWLGPIQFHAQKVVNFFYPYIHVTFPEYQGDGFERSKAFSAIERYLNANSTKQAKRLKANVTRDSESIVLAMADHEEVTDEYKGVKLWWASSLTVPNHKSISFFPREDEKMYFNLKFHRRHRELIAKEYLKHVLDEGKAISVRERQRKLYTNSRSEGWDGGYGRSGLWSHVAFHHPATFDTLAMDPEKKEEIVKDLTTFSKAKDYYAKIGKAWKRGYLLHGPPGTGKSTMIAAMANFLKYDIYDLELTAVKDNTELRKLLIDTTSKSIIVIEDIDCSLDLTGQREKNRDQKAEEDTKKKEDENKDDGVMEKIKKLEKKSNKTSQVTLSGLLNFIDGLWSACGGERIIVFTTNYVEKLDPALIRRGRMDKHIELAYCGFESFKLLAKNYLDVGMDHSNELFVKIRQLLEETKMTPADVAENLMPKSSEEDAETCLSRLIEALEVAKEEARVKAEEEEKLKAEKSAMKEEDEKKEKEKEKEKENSDKAAKENGQSNKETNGTVENGVHIENGVAKN
ncbi:AAA-ATPase ASD, mitochondrial-like [Henckelia pumila]|uniref:AAA-ATPase ASD, mitochondrial-like n=1 Tax=Henckelia pumila TaxID=405737 RepID=UPI003C6E9638